MSSMAHYFIFLQVFQEFQTTSNKIIKTQYYVAYGVAMKFDIKKTKILINSF